MYNIFQELLNSTYMMDIYSNFGNDVLKDYVHVIIMLYRTGKCVYAGNNIRTQKLKDIVVDLFGSCDLTTTYDEHGNTVFYLN